jgi:small subunit ribosomal protein S18
MAKANEIKYLTAIKQEKRPKKFCRFKKYGIRYIDYKDVEFLKKFLNEQGKMLPRRITGNSLPAQGERCNQEGPPDGPSALRYRSSEINSLT